MSKQVASTRGHLEPTDVLHTERYTKRTTRVSPGHTNMSAGLWSSGREPEPQYLPPGWSVFVHPEGQRYFARNSRPRIVTEADMYSDEIQGCVARWIKEFEWRCTEHQTLINDDAELFLQLDTESDLCRYYLVDYLNRVVFWLEENATDVLGLPATVTDTHLRLVLEEHYWIHVEYFSMHRCQEVDLSLDQLKTTLLHARVDQLTSATSTFPYGAKECAEFLDVVKTAHECVPDGNIVATIARLWNTIVHHRFTIHYGEQYARLSRDQSILDCDATSPSRLFGLVSRLCFRIPEANVRELDDLYVDNLVYVEPWRKAMKAHRADWLVHASWALALLTVDILACLIPQSSHQLAMTSMLFCNTSLMSAVVLTTRHQWATTSDASDAATYLSEARRDSSGFCWTALAFSLPKALFLWALIFTSMQGFVWLESALELYALVPIFFLLLVVGLCCGALPFSWELPCRGFLARLRGIRSSETDECAV